MAGTKGRDAGAVSIFFSGAGTAGSAGLAVTDAGAFPSAPGGVTFTVPRGGQMGWTLSATRAPVFHSVFHVGRTGSAPFTGWALNAGRTFSPEGRGETVGSGAGAMGLWPCSR